MIPITLHLLPDSYSICRLPPDSASAVSFSSAASEFFSLTRTKHEISIVCLQRDAPADAKVEPGWRAFSVQGPLDFSLVGVLATITTALAEAEIPVFAISTFDTDYVFVCEELRERARHALQAAGHTVRGEEID
jgi:uncharacterized protein